MNDLKQVDLLIQAKLKGKDDIATVTRSIQRLQDVITEQAAAAAKGEGDFKTLQQAIAALGVESEKLNSRRSALKYFQGLDGTIAKTSTQVDKLVGRYDDLNRKIAEAPKGGTDTQNAKLRALGESVEAARARLAKLRKEQVDLGAAFREIGVDTNALGAALGQVDEQVLRVGSAIEQAKQQVVEYSDVTAKAVAASKRFADEQGKLSRLQAGNDDDARLGAQQRLAAVKKLEQAESDRLALLQRLGAAERANASKVQASSELAALRDSEAFSKKFNESKVRDTGLRKAADDAQAAAAGYNSLTKASTDLRPKIVSLRDAVDAINDPGKAARATLAGIEAQIADVARAAAQTKEPIKDIGDQFKVLRDAQRGLSVQGGQVDAFRQQQQALRASQIAFNEAKADVQQYAAVVRQGGEAGAAMAAKLAEARAKVAAAGDEMRKQADRTRVLAQALRDAGINTGNLVESQQRLTAAAKAGVSATNALAQASERQGKATTQAAGGFSLFRDEGRTTLSLIQRIRGQVLALGAAYTGLYAIVGLFNGALEASKVEERLRSSIAFAQGLLPSDAAVGREVQYITEQSNRLGISLEATSKSYGRFSAAALKSGGTVQETRFIFESMSEAATVLGFSGDQIDGLFNAIGQSFSKGKIQSEELVQQIGERLPGAFAFAQEALKKQFPDLVKALEQGKVGAENFVIIAESIRRAASAQLPQAIKSLQAEQNRFNNELLLFKKEVADAGFANAYINLLKQLTGFLQSSDGKAFAQSIGQAFAAITNGVTAAVGIVREYGTELKAAAIIGGTILGLLAVQKVVAGLLGMRAAVFGLSLAMTGLQKAFVGFQIAALALNIVQYLRDNEVALSDWAKKFSQVFLITFSKVGEDVRVFFKGLPLYAAEAIAGFLNRLPAESGLRKLLNFEDIERKLVALRFDTAFDIQEIRKSAAATRAQLTSDFNRDKSYQQAINGQRDARGVDNRLVKQIPETTAFPGVRAPKNKPEDKDAKGQIEKRASEIEALEKALDALDNKIDRKNKDVLSDQIAVVDREFAAMAKRIAELGGDEAARFAKRLSAADLELRAQTEKAYGERRLAALEGLLKQVEDAEVASGRKRKSELDIQLAAIETAYLDKYRAIEAERNIIEDNGGNTAVLDQLRKQLDAAKASARASAEQLDLARQLAQREEQINDLVKTRESRIKSIEDRVAAGIITREQGDQQQRDAIAALQPEIERLAATGAVFAETIQGAFDPTKVQEFLEKLELVRGSGARMNVELDRTGKIVREGLDATLSTALDKAYDGLVDVASGTRSWGDAFKSVGTSILLELNKIIRELITAAIRAAILRAISQGSGSLAGATGFGDYNSTGAIAAVRHSGGVVGGTANRTRNVGPSWFANAPRYHTGGIVGLAADEYPAILQKNEEVLSKTDPRNVLNGGFQNGRPAAPTSQRFVLVDDRSRVAEAMAGAEGEEVTMVHIRKNLPSLRQQLRGT